MKAEVRSQEYLSRSEDKENDVPLAQMCSEDEDDDMKNHNICAISQKFGRDGEFGFAVLYARIVYIKNKVEKTLPKISFLIFAFIYTTSGRI